MKIEGKVAIITGGASGLGKAAAKLLSQKGCNVVIADLNDEGVEIAKSLTNDQAKVFFFKTNVIDETNVENLIAFTLENFGCLHFVVNCAGILAGQFLITKNGTHSTPLFKKMFEVNVVGTFLVSKLAAQAIAKNEKNETGTRGVIVNIASIAGFEAQRGQVAYGGTKGAIIGMTLPMARDLSFYGIRVVAVAPGLFETPMGENVSEKAIKNMVDQTTAGRLGNPIEFAHFVGCILENDYLSGTTLRLDGGIRLPKF